ncbi:hypothetical protein BOX15_Mlig004861g1, partial [Macrostomum lignano]
MDTRKTPFVRVLFLAVSECVLMLMARTKAHSLLHQSAVSADAKWMEKLQLNRQLQEAS